VTEMLGQFEVGKVHHADCLEAMRLLPAESVHMIWTDPPYGLRYNENDLAANREKALGVATGAECEAPRPIMNDGADECERVVCGMLDEAKRVLVVDCCCCCCCGGGGPTPIFADFAKWMDARLAFDQAVVWDKVTTGMGWRYRRSYEFIMVAHRTGGKLRWFDDSHKIRNIVALTNVPPRSEEHPCRKPVALVEHFLRLHTQPGDIVLDPFAGGGSTGVACARLGRRFIGFELEQKWVDLSNRRIAAERERLGEVKPQDAKSGQQAGLFAEVGR
jgi:DNA modification methylase